MIVSQIGSSAGDQFVVTIDGPAGTGKSSVARELARQLDFAFLDTGAMYRAVALGCVDSGADPDDASSAAAVAERLAYDAVTGCFPNLDGSLRTPEVTEAASRVARHAAIRDQLVTWQRQFAAGKRLVTEGRDQGTDVFPNAECKFFLTATVDERARRRLVELTGMGHVPDIDIVRKQIADRDQRDQTRNVSPLRPAEDARVIDTTAVPIKDVIQELRNDVERRISQAGPGVHEPRAHEQ